jgi:hypothetical protein
MRRKLTIYCEHCGNAEAAHEFVVFHSLTFCSAECRDDYRAADDARREAKHTAAQLATVADVMRRNGAARKVAPRKRRAA